MTAPSMHALSRLLDDSFALWWRGLRWTAPIALLAALPSLRSFIQLPGLAELQADPQAVSLAVIEPLLSPEAWRWWAGSALLALWLGAWQMLLFDRLRLAQPLRPLQALLRASLRLPKLLLAMSLYLLLCALPLLPLLVFSAWLGLQALPLPLAMGLSVLASLLLALPIAWVAVRLMFLPYAATLTGAWPWRALADSRQRSRGQWWRLMVFVSVPLTLQAFAAGTVAALPAMLAALPAGLFGPGLREALGHAATLAVAALTGPLLHACLVSAYRERV